jgi:amino acid transporter
MRKPLFVAMARHITNAGALYAYISRGLGRPLGVGAALVAALAYNMLQVGLYGMFGPTLAQSVIGLAVIVVYALAGWDPMVRLFFWLGTSGAFGVLCLLAVTSIAVIRFFARERYGENPWRRLLAPVLATLALLAMVWAGLANYATLLGVAPGSTEAWALPASFAVAAVVGVAYGAWLRSARPNVYQGIGFGADALAELATPGTPAAQGT